MSRAEEINKLVDYIISRQFRSVSTAMDGISTRSDISVAILVDKSLLLYNLWEKFSAKNKEVDRIDVSVYKQWAKLEISGYKQFDFNGQDGKMKELCSCREMKGGWIRYSITELELAHNSNQRLFIKDNIFLYPKDILLILKNVYAEVKIMASEIGKEIDIKIDYNNNSPYNFDSLGSDESGGGNYDDDYDPTGGAFTGGDY